jgi:hypothetical protein
MGSASHQHMRTFRFDPISTMQRGSRAALVIASFACVGLTATTASAATGPRLALDLDYAVGVDETAVDAGGGGTLRFGYKVDLALCSITPEVGAAYYSFGGASKPNLFGGVGGVRVGFLKVIEPSIFAHVGYVNLEAYGVDQANPLVDVGLALDFTLLPLLDVGVHGAYSAVLVKDANAFDWARLGAHAALQF